nr:MAG TPA: hypothetical protein [Caudoviricetes sp.]
MSKIQSSQTVIHAGADGLVFLNLINKEIFNAEQVPFVCNQVYIIDTVISIISMLLL